MRPNCPEASVTAPPLLLLPTVAKGSRVSEEVQLETVGWKVRLANPTGVWVVPAESNVTTQRNWTVAPAGADRVPPLHVMPSSDVWNAMRVT